MKIVNFKNVLKFFPFLALFVVTKKNRITFCSSNSSGNNITPVYEKLRKMNKDLELRFFNYQKNRPLLNIISYFKLLRSRMIITTHGSILNTRKNITIDLWHGIPIKGVGLMDKTEKKFKPFPNKYVDYFNCYSKLCEIMVNSCYGLNYEKYIILGSPRNDFLFQNSKTNIDKIFKINKDEKIIFFMPTFRKFLKKEEYRQFIRNLGFDTFDFEKFNTMLEQNKIKFIIKPHPFAYSDWKNNLDKFKYSNIRLLMDDVLISNNIDLYQILGEIDLLITDYSSVYIDFLLINKPIIFIPTDLEDYKEKRNLLLEPYDFWTPGQKCKTQEELENEIFKSLNNPSYFQEEREKLKKVFHKYDDDKSTERVVEFILSKMGFLDHFPNNQ